MSANRFCAFALRANYKVFVICSVITEKVLASQLEKYEVGGHQPTDIQIRSVRSASDE